MEETNRAGTIDAIISSRRSIYPVQYNGKKIPQEIILRILENANQAPTHHYTEPWRFKVFSGKSLERLVNFFIEEYKQNTAPEKFSQKKIDKYAALPGQVSHIVAIWMKRQLAKEIPEIEEILAVGCAIQNIYLSVSEYGLGGYLSTGTGTYTQALKDFLQIGPDDKFIGFFYLGYYEGKRPPGKKRRPVQDKIAWMED